VTNKIRTLQSRWLISRLATVGQGRRRGVSPRRLHLPFRTRLFNCESGAKPRPCLPLKPDRLTKRAVPAHRSAAASTAEGGAVRLLRAVADPLQGPLIAEMIRRGHSVTAMAPAIDEHTAAALRSLGATPVSVALGRTSINPLEGLRAGRDLRRVLRESEGGRADRLYDQADRGGRAGRARGGREADGRAGDRPRLRVHRRPGADSASSAAPPPPSYTAALS
jgi:hypothetical protein